MVFSKGDDEGVLKVSTLMIQDLLLQPSVALAARSALRVAPAFRISSETPYKAAPLIESINLLAWLSGLVGFIKVYEEHEVLEILKQAESLAIRYINPKSPGYKAGLAAIEASRSAQAVLSKSSLKIKTSDKGTMSVANKVSSALIAAEAVGIEFSLQAEFNHAIQQDFEQLKDPNMLYNVSRQPFWPDKSIPPVWEEVMFEWENMLRGNGLIDLFELYDSALRGGFDWETPYLLMKSWGERVWSTAQELEEEDVELEERVKGVEKGKDHREDETKELGGRASAITDKVAEQDRLGRKHLIDALSALLTAEEDFTPLTVGILGEWGAGKSSVMRMLQSNLERDQGKNFEFAWFNAWAYENVPNISAALAQEVVEGLTKNVKSFRRFFLAVCYAWHEHKETMSTLVIGLELAVIFGWFAYVSHIGDYGAKLVREYPDLSIVGGLTMFLGGTFYAWKAFRKLWEHPFSRELKTFLQLPKYGMHLGFGPELRRQIQTLCRMRLGLSFWSNVKNRLGRGVSKLADGKRPRRLIVFVDDLDRCSRKYIMQTLESIRLIMDIKHVIVLIAIDQRIALGAAAAEYHALKGGRRRSGVSPEILARLYLGKIIQIAIRLEDPSEEDLLVFINEALFHKPRSSLLLDKDANKTKSLDKNKTPAGPVVMENGIKPRIDGVEDRGPTLTLRPSSLEGETDLEEQASSVNTNLETEQASTPDLQKEMEESVEEIRDFFTIALQHSFSNPRQLLRLRNSYRLLKLLNAFRKESIPQEELLRMLFWQEFLHQWPGHVQKYCIDELFGRSGSTNPPRDVTSEITTVINKVKKAMNDIFINQDHYDRVESFTKMLVLPCS